MTISGINNGPSVLQKLDAFEQLIGVIKTAPLNTPQNFRKHLESRLRDQTAGWSTNEYEFTSIQPLGKGRSRAIDFCNVRDGVGIELELSNQNAISHDLLKLETAYKNDLIIGGILIVPSLETRNSTEGSWPKASYYATYEYANHWLNIFRPSLSSPIVVLGV